MNPIPLNVATPPMAPTMAYQGCCPIMACGSDGCPIVQSMKKMNKGIGEQSAGYTANRPEDAVKQSPIEVLMGNSANYAAPSGKPGVEDGAGMAASPSYRSVEQMAAKQAAYSRSSASAPTARDQGRTTYMVTKVNGKMVAREISPSNDSAGQSYRAQGSQNLPKSSGGSYHARGQGVSSQRNNASTSSVQTGRYAAAGTQEPGMLKARHAEQANTASAKGNYLPQEAPRTAPRGNAKYAGGSLENSSRYAQAPSSATAPANGAHSPHQKQPTLDAVVSGPGPKQGSMSAVPSSASYTVHQAKATVAIEAKVRAAYAGNVSVGASALAGEAQAMPSPVQNAPPKMVGVAKSEYAASPSLGSLVAAAYARTPGEQQVAHKGDVSASGAPAHYARAGRDNERAVSQGNMPGNVRVQRSEPATAYRAHALQQATAQGNGAREQSSQVLHARLDYLLGAYARAGRLEKAAPDVKEMKDDMGYERPASANPDYKKGAVAAPVGPSKRKAEKKVAQEKILIKKRDAEPEKAVVKKPAERASPLVGGRKKAVRSRRMPRLALRTRLEGMDARMLAIAVALNG